MKNTFTLIIALLLFSFTTAQDQINTISGPSEVKRGQDITVNVSYTASETRDILVFLQLNEDPWTNAGFKKIKVAAGESTVDVVLKASDEAKPGSNYKIASAIVPAGKSWPQKLDHKMQTGVIFTE